MTYEHYHQRPSFEMQHESDLSCMDSYPTNTMANFNYNSTPVYNTIPYSYCDAPATYAPAPAELKYDVVRSVSRASKRSAYDVPPASFTSGSVGSATSSTVGSPYSGHANMVPYHGNYLSSTRPAMLGPAIVRDDAYLSDFIVDHSNPELCFAESDPKLPASFVDPGLISAHPDQFYPLPTQFTPTTEYHQPSLLAHSISSIPSPVPSNHSYTTPFGNPVALGSNQTSSHAQRRMSISSQRSGNSPRPSTSGDEETEKGRCPHPECGRVFKDLKAHMLTHQSERPEKCPIANCEYNQKGFARKYDKNRHTLTHYRGTMVCGFCPGSGSPAEKSFNRADVFKRHLTSVHGVEQNPPNSRKRSPGGTIKKLSNYCEDATGKCSTCSATFSNAQDFYEHLDDCVLRVVQKEEPSERINAGHLVDVDMDPVVQATFDRNMIKTEEAADEFADEDDEDDEDEMDDDEDDNTFGDPKSKVKLNRGSLSGHTSKKPSRRGMTWSKGGVALVGKGRKRRKHYPPSWGMSAEKMRMKKRVLCVYDGSRRLMKDDMMLRNEFEVRMRLPDGNNYVTDLDVETLKRADGFHNATEEEKGPYLQDFLSNLMD